MVEASIYEHLFPLTTVMKQRFVEHWDGDVLCANRWTARCFAGTNTSGMLDGVCGGFRITTGTSTNNGRAIDFNNIKQYCDSGSVFIAVHRGASTALSLHEFGAIDGIGYSASCDFSYTGQRTAHCACNYEVRSRNAGGETFSSAGVALDTCYHIHKQQFRACDIQYTFDGGCVNVTHSCNLPATGRLHPSFIVQTFTTAAKTGEIIYSEAYNT